MDKIKPLFTASAKAVGGRNGVTQTSDGTLKINLSVPKEMSGSGKAHTYTPEHLFAMGYAACFAGAVDFVAKKNKKDATHTEVRCSVSIGPREPVGFGLSVQMMVEDNTLPQEELEDLVKEAHEDICPYSHATRNNIEVKFEVKGS